MRMRGTDKPLAIKALLGLLAYRVSAATAVVGTASHDVLYAVCAAVKRRLRSGAGGMLRGQRDAGARAEVFVFCRATDQEWRNVALGLQARLRPRARRRRPPRPLGCLIRRCQGEPGDYDGWRHHIMELVTSAAPRFGVAVHCGHGTPAEIVQDVQVLEPMFSDRTTVILWGMMRLGTRRAFAALLRLGWLGAWAQDFAILSRPPVSLPRHAETTGQTEETADATELCGTNTR